MVLRIGSADGNFLTLWEPNMTELPHRVGMFGLEHTFAIARSKDGAGNGKCQRG